jgi:Lar family restriction alleviation protein
MSEKLLHCPFCGSDNVVRGGDDKMVAVFCRTCGACGPDEYGSIAAWNRRTPAPEGEAVAWRAKLGSDPDRQHWTLCTSDPSGEPGWHSVQPLYASPVVPVSREEISAIIMKTARLDLTAGFPPFGKTDNPREIADAILAALRQPVVPVGVSRERVRLIVSGLILGFTDFTVAEREAFIDRKTDAILAALRLTDTGREG